MARLGHIARTVVSLIADPGVVSLIGPHPFLQISHEIFLKVTTLSADPRRVVVSHKRKYVH